jgi:hypothetical protein
MAPILAIKQAFHLVDTSSSSPARTPPPQRIETPSTNYQHYLMTLNLTIQVQLLANPTVVLVDTV